MVVIVSPCIIGEYTYAGEHSHISQRTTIGRYCSIGNLCTIGAQRHATDRLTTFPIEGVEDDGRYTAIGHDVWVGCNSVIMSGLIIGTGAIIGAGSVVTHDVPPYAIVWGSPAKVHKYRFDEATIAALLASQWWELPLSEVKNLKLSDILDGKINLRGQARIAAG